MCNLVEDAKMSPENYWWFCPFFNREEYPKNGYKISFSSWMIIEHLNDKISSKKGEMLKGPQIEWDGMLCCHSKKKALMYQQLPEN